MDTVNLKVPVPTIPNPKDFILGFNDFLKEYNVIGLGIGALVASLTLDMGKSFTDAVIMPAVYGITTGSVPEVSFYGLLQSTITFLVSMLVVFLLIKMFKLRLTRPIQLVQVVDPKRSYEGRY